MNGLAWVTSRYNRNSIAALTGVLEAHPHLSTLPLYFLKEVEAPAHVPELASRLDHLVVAFSFATLSLPRIARLIQQLRPLPPPHRERAGEGVKLSNITLIAGGPHPSGDPEGTLLLGVDAVVVGEGEIALPALLERIFQYPISSLHNLPGVATLRDGKLVRNHRPPWADLNDYPPFGLRHGRVSHIELSRGCPYGCTFCQTPRILGGKVRHRSVERVIHWIKKARRGGYRYARFVTPNAFAYSSPDGKTLNLKAMEHLLSEVNRLLGREGVYFGSFPSEVRPENVTEEAVALVTKYAVNDNLVFGVQTCSPRMLRALRRGHTVEDVYRATEITARAGLTPILQFIFGLPGETEEDRQLTFQAIRELTTMGAVIRSNTFMPLPGSPLADAPPGHIDYRTRRFLDELAGRGEQFGHWRQQEQLAAVAYV
jgi:B12-binding domain/radical SAM domain protein